MSGTGESGPRHRPEAGGAPAAPRDGSPAAERSGPASDAAVDAGRARRLAERYRLEYVDLTHHRIDQDLLRTIPADLMLRYGFVPGTGTRW